MVGNLLVTAPETLGAYRQLARHAMQKHGGVPAAAGPTDVLKDNGVGPLNAVVLTFPDKAAVEAWFNDPDLAKLHAMRNAAAKSTMMMVPAVAA